MICGVNKVDELGVLPPVQTSIESSQYVEVPCYTSLPRYDQSSLEFRIDKNDGALDISSMFIHLNITVYDSEGNKTGWSKKEKKKDPKDAKKEIETTIYGPAVAGVNQLAYAMFSSAELFVSDQKVCQSAYYPWLTYVRNLLYQSPTAKRTSLRSALWFDDDAFLFEQTTLTGMISNAGFKERASLVTSSNPVDMVAKVMLDGEFTPRVLPTQTEVTLRFNRSDPKLCLMSEKGSYRIQVNEAKLYILKMKLTEQSLQRQNQLLASGGIDYPCKRYDTRTFTMMKGAQNLDWVPFNGRMPRKVYIFQVTQEAYNGNIAKNPYNFATHKLEKVQVLVNETSMITSQPSVYDSAFKDKLLYINTIMNTTEAPFNEWEFSGGYFVIVVDLTRDHSASCNYVDRPVLGNLRILADYNEPLKESTVMFCIAEFDSVLHLDENRNPSWTS